jgi:hypothetical protein
VYMVGGGMGVVVGVGLLGICWKESLMYGGMGVVVGVACWAVILCVDGVSWFCWASIEE